MKTATFPCRRGQLAYAGVGRYSDETVTPSGGAAYYDAAGTQPARVGAAARQRRSLTSFQAQCRVPR
ncbi:hypothetical protein FRACA_3450002 [Frankia canadensis]|uniref:Uncharacterized protein n=1 Tax=Frankia canadensis TaxID=1836972 RepID=A0A2I2KV57_9ACTN|nr:hypothetical protein FRACA_3450002 [Frankia canadensis]SOU56847.1 hypothetical protein FRACA_3450002 [Frankia canadensis]